MKKILIILILVLILNGCGQEIKECIPAECCHPTTCVLKENAPDCKETMCTLNCEPETLDCGQGKCGYINGKCEAVYNGQ